jgi:Zn-dependent peptidase ImmA (M78 family)/DNA-binding XRE family transcriptional regulator
MVGRSTPALVEPDILRWARASAGLSLDEAASSIQTKPNNVEAWETGAAHPSMAQVRKMASAYKRLLSDFFLPAPPPEDPLPHDFRRLPGEVALRYSRALRYQLRLARQRRALALDFAAELEVDLRPLELRLTIDANTDKAGAAIRDFLGLDLARQRAFRDARKSYNDWRALIEARGVLVFQVTGIEPSEALGFSLTEQPLPVIAVNRKLAPNGRTFTLLHELVHVLLGIGGICDLDEADIRAPSEQRMEVFCNAVAAAALVPREALLAEPLVANATEIRREWSDLELDALGRVFGVSKETVLRRLLATGRTTQSFYTQRRAAWTKLFELTSPVSDQESEFRRNMPQEVVSDLGRPFTRLVLESYASDRTSLSDVSRYLGLRAQQVDKVRALLAKG